MFVLAEVFQHARESSPGGQSVTSATVKHSLQLGIECLPTVRLDVLQDVCVVWLVTQPAAG